MPSGRCFRLLLLLAAYSAPLAADDNNAVPLASVADLPPRQRLAATVAETRLEFKMPQPAQTTRPGPSLPVMVDLDARGMSLDALSATLTHRGHQQSLVRLCYGWAVAADEWCSSHPSEANANVGAYNRSSIEVVECAAMVRWKLGAFACRRVHTHNPSSHRP